MSISTILDRLDGQQRALLLQVARYALVGFGVTCAQAAVYWVLATLIAMNVQIANVAGYLVAVVLGYFLHGSYSFADQEQAGGRGAKAARTIRFVTVSLVSLGLNAFWVWLWVQYLALPTWVPIPFMLVVTPGLVFVLNKKWVFR